MLDRLDETIVAISSAPGYGQVGIIRLSGPQAVAVVDQMACTETGEPLRSRPGSTRISGQVMPDNDFYLPAEFYVFRAPRSYTRQDIVEVYTVGSPVALEAVRRRACQLGAEAAQPGEFTARALLNGAMCLEEAEAVAHMIRAQSDAQLRASRSIKHSAFSRSVQDVRDALANLLALVEAEIDFAEEPIDFITPAALRNGLRELTVGLSRLLIDAAPAERLDVLPHILLFGPPNVGKSSLMNRLSRTSRAICAAVAGTTRDVLSAPINLGRCEAVLLDSAGVDESVEELAAAARELTLSAAQSVDLVCLVLDAGSPLNEAVMSNVRELDVARTVVVGNKSDLLAADESHTALRDLSGLSLGPCCLVSALTGAGLDELRATLAGQLAALETTIPGEALLATERQRSGVAAAIGALDRATALADAAGETLDCAELLAFELRDAVEALGNVTGAVLTEDLLSQVFANFCIGK